MRKTIAEFREQTSRARVAFTGLVRRLVVSAVDASGLWQLIGFDGIDGEKEPFGKVEVFHGVGFVSRPRDGANAEAIVLNVGGSANHPVAVATRDRSIEVSVDADETAIFTSLATQKITKTGDILLSQKAGATIKLGGAATESLLKGTTYRVSEASMHAANGTAFVPLAAALAAFAAIPVPTPADMKTIVAAIGTFLAAVRANETALEASAASYLSAVTKTE